MNYPKHCIGCSKESNCQQKQFMNPNTEPVNGYADLDAADYICQDCLDYNHRFEPMGCDTEVDSPAHCSICGVPLDCQLTPEGVKYVKEAIDSKNGCYRELWPVLFADYFV